MLGTTPKLPDGGNSTSKGYFPGLKSRGGGSLCACTGLEKPFYSYLGLLFEPAKWVVAYAGAQNCLCWHKLNRRNCRLIRQSKLGLPFFLAFCLAID